MRAWEEFLAVQECELGSDIVQKWLRPLKLVHFDACNLYLEASDSFRVLWFEEHMRKKIQKGLYNNNHKPIKVHIAISTQNHANEPQEITHFALKQAATPPPPRLQFDEFDQEISFEDFVITQNALLPFKIFHEACTLESQPPLFNPIYLFGRSGTGKTHLLKAAASLLQKKGKKVIYVRAETFTEHVVDAIRNGGMQPFRNTYRKVDGLIIDDIEVFSRKAATQEEFFHTFNTLQVEGKQIILSSCLPPSELKYIEPRLISRFEWGIVVPLLMPTADEMRIILLKRLEQLRFELDETNVNFLLQTFGRNTKILLRALNALILRRHLNQGIEKSSNNSLSLKSLQNILKDLMHEEERAAITPAKIIQAVAEYYGIRMDDILGKSQAREYVLPRQIATYICRQQLKLPFMKIGEIFCRDHSTIMTSVKQIEKGISQKTPEISGPIDSILKLIETG